MITECIILAAGYSSRANTNKMLLSLRNKTVIECCIDSFYATCSKIYVVGGYRMEEIVPVLTKYDNLELVYNAHYPEGMFRSVKEGLTYIKGDRFFLTPGDYPLIKKETLDKMLDIDEPIVIPKYDGIGGHPVLMRSSLTPEILSGRFESLREFITTKKPLYVEVDDIGVVTDIDYMEDYYRITSQLS